MSIRPVKPGVKYTPPEEVRATLRAEDYAADLTDGITAAGATASEGLAEVTSTSGSANAVALNAAKEIKKLAGLPLVLWWDGTGEKPQLRPGWALLNSQTGKLEKG